MPGLKISKVAKDLNISLQTVIDFLGKKGIEIDGNPNTRIDDQAIKLLTKEFKPEGKTIAGDNAGKGAPKSAPAPTEPHAATSETREPVATRPEAQASAAVNRGPRIVGKIELDRKGNPISRPAHKTEP
ncbi:MAG: translation initiation factor IF-2 N-terminal domain-containing protein, partial [Paramuribaculum sp.]|nr:translation initiation factor IF-2 N-terminal domain-containing protein [Paramuribaculum sp.]